MKDKRIVYKNKKIEVDGNVVFFDGKYNPDTDTLKVYRYHGDINLREEAFQGFCIENNYTNLIIQYR